MKSLRNMMGNEQLFADRRVVKETDFLMCGHCQATVDVTPGKSVTDAGAFCSTCGTVVCPRCAKASAKTGLCLPWEKAMEQEERDFALLRRWGLDDPKAPRPRLILPS